MNNATIKECHMIIDQSDPFLVEVLVEKTTYELGDYILQLNRELETVHPSNVNRIRYYQDAVKTATAIMELKYIRENEDDDLNKGYSIA